jgi:radical SAM family uncharacterized protein/radical SAM-linked protein
MINKTEFIDTLLPFVSKASRYLGNEINASQKDPAAATLRVALAFPDVYEVGMSHLGFQILYNILNDRPDVACERVFTPWLDMEAALREQGIPLCSLESAAPLGDFHIIGFSLQYELSYSNILKMLSLAGIPLLAAQRDDRYPLIIAGGPCMFNPEPVAAFFDAVVIGDGEDVILELCDIYLQWKKERTAKTQLLERLAEVAGIYVPSLFHITYNPAGTMEHIESLKQGYNNISKRICTNLDAAPYCSSYIVPFMEIIHDRISLEIARGCSRGCRFCMAGMIYRPVRERSLPTIMQLAQEALNHTGYEELSLTSLSSGDFTGIDLLLKTLMRQYQKERIAISLPSLRAETLSRSLMEQIKQVRKTGFTIAPEAGTQRLRDVINKNLTEDAILHTVNEVFAAGWSLIKLYFMIGLPTETPEDVEGIVDLSRKIAAIGKRKRSGNQVNVSISTFVPKPHTPFQWVSQISSEEIRAKQSFLMNSLRGKGMRLKWHSPDISLLEGVFSRGSRQLSAVLVKAQELGAGFDAWTEHFNPELWDRAFLECGIDKYRYLQAFPTSATLPWHHINSGVSADFLLQEYRKAFSGVTTPDCRTTCQGCGVCPTPSLEMTSSPRPHEVGELNATVSPVINEQPPSVKYRCTFSKNGPARFLSHLELSRCMARALRRAHLPLKYSQGYHPLPRISFHNALPVGIESLEEVFDLELTSSIPAASITETINPLLPQGLIMISVEEFILKKFPIVATMQTRYRVLFPSLDAVSFPSPDSVKYSIADFFSQQVFFVKTFKREAVVEVNVRPLVRHIDLKPDGSLEIVIHHAAGKIPRLTDILGDILHLGESQRTILRIVKLPSNASSGTATEMQR